MAGDIWPTPETMGRSRDYKDLCERTVKLIQPTEGGKVVVVVVVVVIMI